METFPNCIAFAEWTLQASPEQSEHFIHSVMVTHVYSDEHAIIPAEACGVEESMHDEQAEQIMHR